MIWYSFTLSIVGQHSDGQNIIFTDGEYINQIAACKDVSSVHLLKIVVAMTTICIIYCLLFKR